jgi:hypothetical protein
MGAITGGARNIVTDGLVLYLDAANRLSYPGSGTTWTDLSRGSNNGTLINGPTFNSANGGSIVFDGADDWTSFGNTLNMGTSDFTISAWVKSTSTAGGNNNGIVYKKSTGYPYHAGYRLNMPNGAFNFHIADGVDYNSLSTISPSFNDGKWYNVVGVAIRTQKLQIFVNGQLNIETSSTLATSIDTSVNFAVGALNTAGAFVYHRFLGNIAQTSMYNRALNSSEILQNFNSTRARFGI